MNYDYVKQAVQIQIKYRNGFELLRAIVRHSDIIYIPNLTKSEQED